MAWINLDEVQTKSINTTIALEFDGVIVENDYPQMGSLIKESIPVIHELQSIGYKLILNTKRTNKELDEALVLCNQNNINWFSVNNNPLSNIDSKLIANLYIDTACLGIPLIKGTNNKAIVDWIKVKEIFVSWGMLK